MLEVDARENDNDIADKKRHKSIANSSANGKGVNGERLKANGSASGRRAASSSSGATDRSLLELEHYRFSKGQVMQVVHQFLESHGLDETSRMLREETGMADLDAVDNRLSVALQELRGRNPRIEHAIELIAQFRRGSSGTVTSRKIELLKLEFALLQEQVLQLIFSGSETSLLEAAELLRERLYPRILEASTLGIPMQYSQSETEQRFALQLVAASRSDALELVAEMEWAPLVAASFKQTLRGVQTSLDRLVKPDHSTANRLLSLLATGGSVPEIRGAVLPRTVDLFADKTDKEREEEIAAEKSLLPTGNVQTFFCHADEVWCLEASSDGNMVASASKLGVIQLFLVDKDYQPTALPAETNAANHSQKNSTAVSKRQTSNGLTKGLINGTSEDKSNGKKNNGAKSNSGRPSSAGKRKPKVDVDEVVGHGPLSCVSRLTDATGHELFCLRFSPCNRFLVAGGSNGMLFLWQVRSDLPDSGNGAGQCDRLASPSVKDKMMLKKQIHKGRTRVSSVCWCKPLSSGTTEYFIATGFDCTCKLFNVKGEELASISSDGIHDIKFYSSFAGSVKQQFLITASHRRHRIQKLIVTLPSPNGRKAGLEIAAEFMHVDSPIAGTPDGDRYEGRLFASKVFSPMHSLLDGQEHRVLVNVVDDWIYEYDAQAAKLHHMYTQVLQDESILRPCFSDETKRYLICGSDDGNVYIWDRYESSLQVDPTRTLEGHSARVNAVCAARTKNKHLIVVSASDDSTVRVWTCGRAQDEQAFGLAANGRVKTLYKHRLAAKARRTRLRSLRARRESGGSATSGRRSSGVHSRQRNNSYSTERRGSTEQGEENVAESDMTADEDNSVEEDEE